MSTSASQGQTGTQASESASSQSLVLQALGDRRWLHAAATNASAILPVSDFPPPSTFELSVAYPAIIIPTRRTADLRRSLKHLLLRRPKLSNVVKLTRQDQDHVAAKLSPPCDPPKDFRKLILERKGTSNDVKDDDVFNDPVLKDVLANSSDTDLNAFFLPSSHSIQLQYSDWTIEELLTFLLPDCNEIPSAFETIGSIAHINLRDDRLPYKHWIGKVILDKHAPRIRTVVNKVGTIANEYRTFTMEVLASTTPDDDWSEVTVREEGCQFALDFRTVYWNSRLGGEHRRLVNLIWDHYKRTKDANDPFIVADFMAGIGPFVIPLASRIKNGSSMQIYANDLNPSSYKYLQLNAKKNKCDHGNLHLHNMDGRAFCHWLQQQTSTTSGDDIFPHHVLMNLPASAPEFLDAFRGYGTLQTKSDVRMPRVHVHCFGSKETQAPQQLMQRCSKALGCTLDATQHKVVIHAVRDVAPKKNMYCVSFDLPRECCALPQIDVASKRRKEDGDDDGNGNGKDVNGDGDGDDNDTEQTSAKRHKVAAEL